MIYIYTLSHPITNEVRYVGKTINLKRRYKQHLYDKRQKHKYAWIQLLKNEGLKPILTIIETCTNDNWQDKEKYWITQYDNLINHLEGGGSDYVRTTTEQTKQKISQILTGRNLTTEHKNNLKKSAPNKRKILIDDLEYNSIMEASNILQISHSTIHNRINLESFSNYQYVK